jgi:hypothetical protein
MASELTSVTRATCDTLDASPGSTTFIKDEGVAAVYDGHSWSPLLTADASTAATVFGDSLGSYVGSGSAPANTYPAIVSAWTGWTMTHSNVAGVEMQDTSHLAPIASATITPASRSLWLVGYNDMRHGGTDATALALFEHGLLWGGSCLAIPATSKVTGQGGAVTYVGTWSNMAFYGVGKSTTTQGATATFTTTGSVIYLGMAQTATGGTFSVTVDGVSAGTFSCNWTTNGADHTGGNTIAYGPNLIRLSGYSPGTHTVVITVTSSGSPVYFVWGGGNGSGRGARVYVGNCLKMTVTGYGLGTPFDAGSDEAVTAYNASIAENVATLAGDGLGVFLVNASAHYVPASHQGGDNIHPSETGHARIAAAFLRVIFGGPV